MSVALFPGRLRQCLDGAARLCSQWRCVTSGPTPPPTPSPPTQPEQAQLEYASSCFLPTSWLELPLLSKQEYNHDSTVYSFGLPAGQSLQLPVCACILMRAAGRGRTDGGGKDAWDGTDAVRPYTPVSSNSVLGSFDLLVKRYEGGAASEWLHQLPLGAMVGFKHIKFNIKAQYPWAGKSKIAMLCAGSGITPMYQALHEIIGNKEDDREVTLLYGNKSKDDILMAAELDKFAAASNGRLKIVHILGDSPEAAAPPGWVDSPAHTAEVGWIDEAKIAKYLPPPADDVLVFVCGVPGMYKSLCGPRTEKEIAEGTVLHKLGYTSAMVAKM